VRLKQT
jgi:hypothetical protein